MLTIFVGYDPKEAVAYHTCVNSIIRYSTKPISIVPLSLNLLDFYKETHTDGSSDFTYTRFLVPYLMNYNGWAVFIDGDMILKDDINKLLDFKDDNISLMVVKHDYQTTMEKKYLGAKNENYPRKNWSSVILWNCGSFFNRKLTPEFIQQSTGGDLHRFTWITDEHIGELPIEWNWLPDEYGVNNNAKLIHYTLGTPCFNNHATGAMADEWHKEYILTNYARQI
jgi:lipopolysaccharide biosynthesis glycosyltransferase